MIKRLYNAWQWLTDPSKSITDPEKRRRAQLFSTFLVILIGMLCMLLIGLWVFTWLGVLDLDPQAEFPSIRGAAIILGFATSIYLLSRTRFNTLSIALGVLLITGRIITDALAGHLHLHYLFAPILVVLFFSLVASLQWTAVIASVGLMLLAGIGILIPEATPEMMIPMMFVHIVGSSFILLAVGHRDHQHNQIQQQTRVLQEQNEELRQVNEELVTAREKAEETNRLKDQFLTTMSHELRTPLHAITGYSQILLEGYSGDLNPQQHQNQERILENAIALAELVEDILEISRIEAGRMALTPVRFNLRGWVRDTIVKAQKQAEGKGLDFQVLVDERLPDTLVGDVDSLEQVVVHLLDNAVKFTKTGGVKLVLQCQGKDAWSITVSDTGIGIPAEAHDYIFEEFRQVDGSIRREHGGMGLGLAIVRNMVMIMEGQITVESVVGQGSTFTVVLPLIGDLSLSTENRQRD